MDQYSGNDFGHSESRAGYLTNGEYHVLLPDGRRQKVRYTSDTNGYVADVTYDGEPPKEQYEPTGYRPKYKRQPQHQPAYRYEPGFDAEETHFVPKYISAPLYPVYPTQQHVQSLIRNYGSATVGKVSYTPTKAPTSPKYAEKISAPTTQYTETSKAPEPTREYSPRFPPRTPYSPAPTSPAYTEPSPAPQPSSPRYAERVPTTAAPTEAPVETTSYSAPTSAPRTPKPTTTTEAPSPITEAPVTETYAAATQAPAAQYSKAPIIPVNFIAPYATKLSEEASERKPRLFTLAPVVQVSSTSERYFIPQYV